MKTKKLLKNNPIQILEMSWKHDSSGKVPAFQAQAPELKPYYH
jgi:hypothetical protein